jgi:tyrosine-protein phosphatase YwqE
VFDKLLSFFESSPGEIKQLLHTDIHSHLLPGIDDGVETYDEAIGIIRRFQQLGYRKLITTPHVMQDFYENDSAIILDKLKVLKQKTREAGIEVELEAAAEYYLDESLIKKLESPEQLLTFGKKYLLFETSFINKPMYLDDFLFLAQSKGFIPVMAHPERYAFIHNEPDLLEALLQRGMLLQINMNSLSGYYSREVQKMAKRLIDKQQIHFLGSDCHSGKHLDAMMESMRTKHYVKACSLPLLNNSLI